MKYLIPQRQFKRKKSQIVHSKWERFWCLLWGEGHLRVRRQSTELPKMRDTSCTLGIMAKVWPVWDPLRSLGPLVELIKGSFHVKDANFPTWNHKGTQIPLSPRLHLGKPARETTSGIKWVFYFTNFCFYPF